MTPLPFTWNGEAMVIRPGFQKRADEAFCIGEGYTLAVVEDRSAASHRHYFAAVNEAWANLPEHLAERWPSAEHLRKAALIRTGYRDERSFACSSRAEAIRMAAFLKPIDDFAMVALSGTTVLVLTAKSQSVRAMGKAVFQESKDAVLNALAEMIGTDAEALARAA